MAKKFVLEKAPFIRRVDNGKVTTNQIMNDVKIILVGKNDIVIFINVSIAPDCFNTSAKPAATSITNATYPIK